MMKMISLLGLLFFSALFAQEDLFQGLVKEEKNWLQFGQKLKELDQNSKITLALKLNQLLQENNEKKLSIKAVWALRKIAPLPKDLHPLITLSLRQVLKSEFPSVKKEAALAIGELHLQGAIEALLPVLNDSVLEVRLAVISALKQLDLSEDKVIPTLILALKDEFWLMRTEVVWLLGVLEAEEAVSALTPLLSDEIDVVRETTVWAFGEIGASAVGVVPKLLLLLEKEKTPIQFEVLYALGEIGSGSDQVKNVLMPLLKSENIHERFRAAAALVKLGEPTAQPILKNALQDQDAYIRFFAAEALATAKKDSSLIFKSLLGGLKDSNWWMRKKAILALKLLKSREKQVSIELEKMKSDPNPYVRRTALKNLTKKK